MTTAEVHERTEAERIEAWRAEELERAGYPKDAAAAVAARFDIDLHAAIALAQRGCPHELALRILL